jgi:antitoxin VapB
MNDMTPIVFAKAKLFWSGRSQAVRLPKAFRFEGTEVLLHRNGDSVVMDPSVEETADPSAWIYELEALDDDATAAVLDRSDIDALFDDEINFN